MRYIHYISPTLMIEGVSQCPTCVLSDMETCDYNELVSTYRCRVRCPCMCPWFWSFIQKKKIELMAKYPKNKENEEQDLWRIRLLSWRTT
jgi:hypothetical protein